MSRLLTEAGGAQLTEAGGALYAEDGLPAATVTDSVPVARRPNWPVVILEAGFASSPPAVPAGTFTLGDAADGILGTSFLGGGVAWTDLSGWVRSGSVSRPASRQQGPLWSCQQGTASVTLNNADGRFDPDNGAGPYAAGGASQLAPMVPVRLRATWAGVAYGLFSGFADSWDDDGRNYGGRYAEAALAASDAQKVLNGVTIPQETAAGAGEPTGARVNRVLDAAGWYTGSGYRDVAAGDSTVQAYTGGGTAWSLMQAAADSEIGELYADGSGRVVFRNRHALLTEARSAAPQAVFGDSPATAELPYASVTRVRDDTTLANDVQATRTGGSLQEVQDAASIRAYLFARTYSRSDLILQDDTTALNWAQWVLYVAKDGEARFDSLVISPLRAPAALWPQVLGREIGDRIQVRRRPPGVASPVTKDCFVRGISHAWDWAAGTWTTTWTLQDASAYGSFVTLDDPVLGQLGSNALAF